MLLDSAIFRMQQVLKRYENQCQIVNILASLMENEIYEDVLLRLFKYPKFSSIKKLTY
jgi:hypothetical protein